MSRASEPRRVVVVPNGPILIDGPVEITMEDGTVVRSDRFVVAMCACRRSKRYPFCDTSHRTRVKSSGEAKTAHPATN
ncbi:CDGSH iron-sulfur domain-containing protein [Kibdelosporangium philippinense]|uniref:CDGSH iron-sulfur domain-containing protein n=1 Tax=Kibdelosporangium philippinense TaxID=211113 RepID=A0ABS8ZAD1_9PSEU|nr:CDGSH iron-sulfur domain-containing protein [Kibdelosporangium philippinense]MCE7004830.1 CDGSH iron-sulfur domain-containing protein [Kibdelosporangium philippinense]